VFERYTEKARRVIFFGRYEASRYGSPFIETEHLLLGLLRENPEITQLFSSGSEESILKQIDANTTAREHISTSVDLPLSNECKRVLAYGAEEAESHLLLGLLRERGLRLDQLSVRFSELTAAEVIRRPVRRPAVEFTVNIHGTPRSADRIQERAGIVRKFRWYWHKRP
jgi:ATP-dependent Clp protease ATP-binding subunit ClpC